MPTFYNPGHPRGTICVLRCVASTYTALAVPQHHFREYAGCFSII